MCVYLRTKFQVPSIMLTSFRQGMSGVILPPATQISVNNNYEQDSRVFYTFVPNKSFGQLLGISPKKNYF